MQDELTAAAKAGLVLSLLKGDLTIQEVCQMHGTDEAEVRRWLELALEGQDPFEVYEKLRWVKRRASMFVFGGGSLACIRLREREEPIGHKHRFWCLPFSLPAPGRGEVILNVARDDFRIAEIDIAGAHLSLPKSFIQSEQNQVFRLEANLRCNRARSHFLSTVNLKFANVPDATNTEIPILSIPLPAPLIGRLTIAIGVLDSEIKRLSFFDATECLPASFFNVVRTNKNNQLDW